ncbi:MAG TPA: PQQ-dependent sugar dehydrogenase [Chitinophagaceae bacterium]|nr:PQQ-dependent sugar dehydrogenase [Chitinophagaceae bacterium]
MSKLYFISIAITTLFFTCCGKNKTGSNNAVDTWPAADTRIVLDNRTHIWEILWGPDNFIWMTERGGKISRVNPKTGAIVFSASISDVVSNGEGGLLGMVLHPDFLTNGLLYVVYNYNNNGYKEKLVRFTFQNNALLNPTTLISNIPASSIHNGSRLQIINAGSGNKIYYTTGDAAVSANAQDINSLSGKVLRLNMDGSVPGDNPFTGNPVWSYGHRNPQGLIYVNNKLYASEHGPDIEDEVNIIEKGRNYGWPVVNGPCNGSELDFCATHNIKQPIWSSGSSTIAVCGIDYYNNNRITQWKNSILMTTLKDASLRQLKLSADGSMVTETNMFFKNSYGRLRDVCISPEGRVYLCTSNGSNDKIIEISKL